MEQSFREGAAPEQAVALAGEFLHEDCAYEAQLHWEIWMPKTTHVEGGWERVQRVVSIMCLGPAFEEGESEVSGHLQINFGLDSALLPPEEWELAGVTPAEQVAAARMRENMDQLLDYERRLEEKLPVARRLLWCESGEDLAEKIRLAWDLDLA